MEYEALHIKGSSSLFKYARQHKASSSTTTHLIAPGQPLWNFLGLDSRAIRLKTHTGFLSSVYKEVTQ